MFVTVDQKKRGGGGGEGRKCTFFLLYLGFNLLNISKTAGSCVSVALFSRTSVGQK